MNKKALVMGAVFGLLTVMIGAFGAHALQDLLVANDRLDVFETGVRYQFYHAVALLICGVLADKLAGSWVTKATYLFTIGIVIFSGSLYVLSITNVTIFGTLTPIGGLMLMGGWLYLIIGIVRSK